MVRSRLLIGDAYANQSVDLRRSLAQTMPALAKNPIFVGWASCVCKRARGVSHFRFGYFGCIAKFGSLPYVEASCCAGRERRRHKRCESLDKSHCL